MVERDGDVGWAEARDRRPWSGCVHPGVLRLAIGGDETDRHPRRGQLVLRAGCLGIRLRRMRGDVFAADTNYITIVAAATSPNTLGVMT